MPAVVVRTGDSYKVTVPGNLTFQGVLIVAGPKFFDFRLEDEEFTTRSGRTYYRGDILSCYVPAMRMRRIR